MCASPKTSGSLSSLYMYHGGAVTILVTALHSLTLSLISGFDSSSVRPSHPECYRTRRATTHLHRHYKEMMQALFTPPACHLFGPAAAPGVRPRTSSQRRNSTARPQSSHTTAGP